VSRVVVVGSLNVDVVVRAERLPGPGETITGGSFARHLGGKGANQAVAAARAGADVVMIGAVGRDQDGDESVAALVAEGIDVSRVRRVDTSTGVAIIAVAADGENQIVVASGANAEVSAADGDLSGLVPGPGTLLACLEVPMAAVEAAVAAAARIGLRAIVNPAPALPLPSAVLAMGPILTPNREELRTLTGESDLEAGVAALLSAGASTVAVTLGAEGAMLAVGDERTTVRGTRDGVVDATGAGDTFSGVLAAWLADGRPLEQAVAAANAAAGLSVAHPGARGGMPSRSQIEAVLRG
jgi:ribokinase